MTSDDDGLAVLVKAKFDAHLVAISQCLYSVDLDTALPLMANPTRAVRMHAAHV